MSLGEYRLAIDYEQPLAAMVATGAYDHANEYITDARFPIRTRGEHERHVVLNRLGRTASTDEVLHALDEAGLQPGAIGELLALGAAQPELQRSFPIVALGEPAAYPDDYRRIPFLWGSERVRHLDLRWDEHSWAGNIRFIGIRGLSTSPTPMLAA